MQKIFFLLILVSQFIFASVQTTVETKIKEPVLNANVGPEKPYLIRPAINSRPGVMNVYSADNFGGNTFAFGYHGEYYEDQDAPFNGTNQFYAEHIGVDVGLTKYLEFYLDRTSTVNMNEDDQYNNRHVYSRYNKNNTNTTVNLGDLELGGKVTIPLARDFKLAGEGSIKTYTDIEGGSNFEGTSYGLRGLATIDLGRVFFRYNDPVLLHLNYQYLYNNSYKIIEESRNDNYRYLGITRYDRMNSIEQR